MESRDLKLLSWLIPAYILIAVIALYTPLHSDDFGTRLAGFPNIPNHIKRYMEWSGRLTPDFIASFIMWSDSHIVRSLLNSVGTFGAIAMIAKIPYSIVKKRIDVNYIIIFYVVMSLIWTTSPNLGQTSFWIVGATNYIWTNFFILIVINKLALRLSATESYTKTEYISVFLLSVIAACGNENMSLVLVGTTFLFTLYSYLFKKGSIRYGSLSFLGSCAGAALLLLAPGNFRRMSMEGAWWQDATWSYKLWLWAFKKMPFVIEVNKPILALIFAAIIFLLVSGRLNTSFRESAKLYLSIPFFIFLMFIANLIMVGSPGYPPRAVNGQYILLLCAFTSSLYLALHYINRYIVFPYVLILICFGAWSYTLMSRAYFYAFKQDEIRRNIMKKEVENGSKYTTIPQYYFRKLFSEGDKFDQFIPKQLPYYFGLKDVKYIKPNFDYSLILSKGNTLNLDLGYAKAVEVWVYNDAILENDKVIVVKLDHYNKHVWHDHEQGFGLQKSVSINSERYTLSSQPRLYAIEGSAYFALHVGDKNIPKIIKSISK